VPIGEWCCGPEFVGELGRHRLVIEADPADPPRLARAFDAALAVANEDYAAHRKGGQMLAPEVVLVPAGRFEAWMRARGKAGGQHKVPRVIADPARFAEAVASLASAGG